MPEHISKLQPERTIYLRGFNSFAAATGLHNASPTGFQVSGTFRDPGDFAVAVLYDADNAFEHPSIRYLPDFNFGGLTLNFSLEYSDGVQPIDSPMYNWIDWATLDVVRADGTTTNIPLWDNATLAGGLFPAASATVSVNAASVQAYDRITLWYENLAFDYTAPGGITGTATYYWQDAGTTASITVGTNTYTYNVVTPGGESAATVAAGVAAAAAGDPQVAFTASAAGVVTFTSKVNTGAMVEVSGYPLWLITYPPGAYLAGLFVNQINSANWVGANTTHGLLAALVGTPGVSTTFTVTAARYGTVNANGATVNWIFGTKFAGLTAGLPFVLGGATYTIASVESATQLTLTTTASSGQYLAPRGGRDGNTIRLYGLATSPSTTSFDQTQYQLGGGSSAVTWNLSLNFTALGIDSLRQCWLTFAPSLTYAAAYTATEWMATFSNWQVVEADGGGSVSTPVSALQVAGPGSVRLEEDSPACLYKGTWVQSSGFYSKYFANVATDVNDSVTVTYSCQFAHNLCIGTSLYGTTVLTATVWLVENTQYNPAINGTFYSDRGVAGITVDGDTETLLDCRVNTGSELVARRLLRTGVAAGTHTVVIRVAQAGAFYFDFLEAAVLSDVPDALTARPNVSAALDFDTNQTYMLTPSRVLWILTKLGYAAPINEYLGVFWWNQRVASGATFSTAQVSFGGTFAAGDTIFLTFNPPSGAALGKSVFSADTPTTVATHFAAFINSSLVGAWASASGGVLTITSRSQGAAWDLSLAVSVSSMGGTATMSPTLPAPGVAAQWVIDDTQASPINNAVSDWHTDFYAQCAAAGLTVVTSCSMELVNPPASGYCAQFPSGNPVSTATGFANLNSMQCAVGASKMLAFQKTVYRQIARLQAAAGLQPYVQYGEFLWWYFADPAGSGMAYYDPETVAAAQTALGRALCTFMTPNDDPTVNGSADALFLRNRLRDYVAALVADIRGAYPTVRCEVLWPYDVNYPTPVGGLGGQLNYYVNLPVEWQQQPASGLDSMKVEALAFATSQRDLDLSEQAIELFPEFGWPLAALRYLVPVFGSATPWERELALVRGAGLPFANLWALDHVCLFNLDVPERQLERRSVVKSL